MAFSRALREFMKQSTLHGLSEIAEPSSRRERSFNIALVVVSYALTFYGFYEIFHGYMNKPVVTTILIQEQDYLDLPDVTICPFNRFNKHFFEMHNVPERVRMFIEWSFFWVNPTYPFGTYPTLTDMPTKHKSNVRDLDKLLEQTNMTMEELINAASFKCSDIFRRCYHEDVEIDCCKESEEVMTDWGRCYRFPSKPQNWAGIYRGLSLSMRLPIENFTESETMLLNDGVMIKLAEKGRGYNFDAIFSPMKVHTLLQLQATRLEFMNDPPRYTCQPVVPHEYSLMRCFDDCTLEAVVKNCSCRYVASNVSDETRKTVPVCKPADILYCAYGVLGQQQLDDPKEMFCRKRCKPACKYWKFSSTVTYTQFPEPFRSRHGEDDIDIVLDVFYEKLDYTFLKHRKSMTMDNFVADVGGQVGLWMGGSILSIIHPVVFLALYCCTIRGGQVGLWMGGSILSIIHLVVFLVLYCCTKSHQEASKTVRSVKRRLTKDGGRNRRRSSVHVHGDRRRESPVFAAVEQQAVGDVRRRETLL